MAQKDVRAMSNRLLQKSIAAPYLALMSIPMVVWYGILPSTAVNGLWAIVSGESRFDESVDNATSSASGLFQMLDGSARFEQYWEKLGIIGIPLQCLDYLIYMSEASKGKKFGGLRRLFLEHYYGPNHDVNSDPKDMMAYYSSRLGKIPEGMEFALIAGIWFLVRP